MDIDAPVSNTHQSHQHILLPGFSASFPLPFRVLTLIGFAILLWATNLHVLSLLGIDTTRALGIQDQVGDEPGDDGSYELLKTEEAQAEHDPADDVEGGMNSRQLAPMPSTVILDSPLMSGGHHQHLPPMSPMLGPGRPAPSSLYGPIYQLFLVYAAWVGTGWCVFTWVTNGESESMEHWRWLVAVVAFGVVVGIASPWRGVGYKYRRSMLRSFKRIIRPSISRPPYFSDVILADILTSFAKVLGDLYVSSEQLWGGGITRGRVHLEGIGGYVVLGMVCLPYLLRFQQCVFEYLNPTNTQVRPLLNALKYASAFPVIFLSAMQRTVIMEVAEMQGKTVQEIKEGEDRWFGEHRLFRLWLFAVIANSMYSFYWDVTNDWGLCLLSPHTWTLQRGSPQSATDASPRLQNRSMSVGSAGRSVVRPFFLTRFVKGCLKPFGYKDGPQPIRLDGDHQRSPFPSPLPSPGTHSKGRSADVSIAMEGLGLSKDAHSPPGSSVSTYPPSLSSISTSSSRPLISTPWFTIPNPLLLGLRAQLLLPDPLVYHLFICIDFVLRFIWSLKLSSHLHTISEIESGVFLMEALELMRRWMWVFLRVEWEVVKRMEAMRQREVAQMPLTLQRPGSPRRRSGGSRQVLPLPSEAFQADTKEAVPR